ncbi:MAG: hypothetical protein PUG17_07285 [Stecheria intestinalis]|nr:hypothetical protein [Stecheria intestinalis]MDY3233085.1 hypothetical protein [Erysipelotrichaceae bacterium]
MTDKEERLNQAAEQIRLLEQYSAKIRNENVQTSLRSLISVLGSLKETQYLFDSGEKELKKLYARYLPYLDQILAQYLEISESGNYEAVLKSERELQRTLISLTDAVRKINLILPQDEAADAAASMAAEKMKHAMES